MQQLANRTSTVQSPVCDRADNPAIAWAPVSRAAKRALDVVAATVGLILSSPTFLLVSIAIKIDSRGPVFRPQMLHGCNNENIPSLKFRTTMSSGTEDDTSFMTRVGAVLRRTGIDGLPQLINVLRGEMSIVGPSPYVVPPNNIFVERIS